MKALQKSLSQPEVLEDVISKLKKLTPKTKALFGPMTVHEIICHCTDGLRISLGIRKAKNRTHWLHRLMKKPILDKWIPDWMMHLMTEKIMGIRLFNVPEMNQKVDGTQPREFYLDLKDLITLIRRLASKDMKDYVGIHPHLGPLNYEELNRINFIHLDYHIKQFDIA